ncbi:hypothetical protein BGZ50_002775 [Haplosporangium sp. Z 11]|nr:hypothetical protein BGZ50_002775 [Haplosporangium sp. Z 11]
MKNYDRNGFWFYFECSFLPSSSPPFLAGLARRSCELNVHLVSRTQYLVSRSPEILLRVKRQIISSKVGEATQSSAAEGNPKTTPIKRRRSSIDFMLWPTPTSSSLPKATAVGLNHDQDRDVLSTNTDHFAASLNIFDNSRPSSPSPAPTAVATAGGTDPAGATISNAATLIAPARVLSPKISVGVPLSQDPLVQPLLRTPPESPINDQRRRSIPPRPRQYSFPHLQSIESGKGQSEIQGNGLTNLSSPPTSPTYSTPNATLPPKLSQSLMEHPLFRGCTEAGIHLLASRMHIRHYHPQDHIIRRSEQSSAMFYVLRGAVKVVSHDNEATYYEIKENNFFGDVGVLYRVPRSMDVLAKNRCTIAILSGDDLIKVMEQSSEMAKAIGYQSQERYQMYLKRRQSVSVKRTLDGGAGGPDQCQDDANSESFVKRDVHSAIRKVPLFQSCSSEVIHLLSLNVEPRTYDLGQSIIRRGEIGREMFFIISGVVEVLSDDNLKVLARFHDGQFFGEIAVLLDVPRIANVKAVSEVEVFVLTKDNLMAVFQAVPGAAETITAEGNRLYRNWLIRSNLQNSEQRAQDESMPTVVDREMNHESLNIPQSIAGAQGGDVGVIEGQSTDQAGSSRRMSQEAIHPFEAGHPAAISVLPMTLTEDPSMALLSPTAKSMDPLSAAEPEPINGNAMQEPQPTPQQPFFDQNAGVPETKESMMEPPMSRNPTIRGLQQSNPKRRRASVAVWSQEDLMKLAEAAQSKTAIDASYTPALPTTMATSFQHAGPETDVDDQAETNGGKSSERRISNAVLPSPKRRTGPATFQDLDECIIVRILNALPIGQLLRARQVSKGWNKLILEHDDILQDIDLSKYKKIVTDAVLANLCQTILNHNRSRTIAVSLRDCFLISDKGLTMLAANLPAVRDLDLHSCWNVTDAGFRSLGMYCSQLRSIDFSNCRKLGDETIYSLYPKEAMTINGPPKEQLVEAVLGPQADHHPQLKDMIEPDLTVDTSMDETQVLMTRRPSIDTEAALSDQHAPEMESSSPLVPDVMDEDTMSSKSNRTGSKVTAVAVPGPKGCPLLSRLNLSYCKNLTDKSFIHLSLYGSKRLESLNLQRCTTISSEAFISLDASNRMAVHKTLMDCNGDMQDGTHPNSLLQPCFPHLKELILSDCTFLTDDAIVALAPNMPRIQVLSLSFCCALTDVAVEAVSEHCWYLKKLDLSFCGSAVSDASLYQIAQFEVAGGQHSLEDLEIRGCVRVTELGVRKILNGCVRLKKLNISSCSGIGSGSLSGSGSPQVMASGPAELGDDVTMGSDQLAPDATSPQQPESQDLDAQDRALPEAGADASGSLAALSNAAHTGQLARKMNALRKGKEWALAQQRPGLKIIV